MKRLIMEQTNEVKRSKTVDYLPPTLFIDRLKMPHINEAKVTNDDFIEYKSWFLAEKDRLNRIGTDHILLNIYLNKIQEEYEYISTLVHGEDYVSVRNLPSFFGQRRNPLFQHIIFDVDEDEDEEEDVNSRNSASSASSESSNLSEQSSNSNSDSSTDNEENYPIPPSDSDDEE